jgi:hypothetical protein
MSTLFSPDSVFLQRFLRLGGYYKGDIDGLVGSKTLAAFAEFEASRRPVHLQDQKRDRHVKIHRGRTRSRFVVTPTSPREIACLVHLLPVRDLSLLPYEKSSRRRQEPGLRLAGTRLEIFRRLRPNRA